MDETRDTSEPSEAEPNADPNRPDPDPSSSADRLAARLADLQNQMEVIAPSDQEKGREALARFREQRERVVTLEEMLAKAREREHELTTAAVRDRARILTADARISELGSIAARVAAAEEARRDAEAVAQENERAAALARTEANAAAAEIALLRSRNAELESDMASIADELAAATVARAEAARLEQERNEARERAQVERRLAAEDRLRAAEADLHNIELKARLRDAERRIRQTTDEDRRSASIAPAPSAADEAPSPSIEPGPTGSDVTQEEPREEREAAPAAVVGADEPSVVTVDEASPDDAAAIDAGEEQEAPRSVPTERPASARPLWSASEPAASVATTADPWAPSEPTMRASTTPSLSEAGATGEKQDVIDLTGGTDDSEDSEEKENEKEPTVETGVRVDPSDHSGGGWTDAWNLLRGRRKD